MFTPRAFAETDLLWLDRLLARDPFVTVLTAGGDGLPELTRLPVLYQRDGDHIELRGHWARANPQARHSGAAKVLVDGPHGYVSASWYPDKDPMARVPTWNYAVAELRGQLQPFDDTDALAQLVSDTGDHFEASAFQPQIQAHGAAEQRNDRNALPAHLARPRRWRCSLTFGASAPGVIATSASSRRGRSQ